MLALDVDDKKSAIAHLNPDDVPAIAESIEKAMESGEYRTLDSGELSILTRKHDDNFYSEPYYQKEADFNSLSLDDFIEQVLMRTPPIVVVFRGRRFVLDGVHRINHAISKKKPIQIFEFSIDKYPWAESQLLESGFRFQP